ncbi:TR19L factor, partial [Cepphus grylle]|nr:TR19L factor [Cepphus grylle]
PDPPLLPCRFYSPEGEREPWGQCLPCATAPRSTPGCPGGCLGWRCRRRARSPETLGRPVGTNGTRVTLMGEEEEEAAAAQAAVLTIVPVFCAMGLLGILVCNLLKKKGYHCTTSKDPQPGGTGEPQLCHRHLLVILCPSHIQLTSLSPSPLHLLPQFPPACRHQQHLHTVQGPAPCARCSQKKWPEVLPPLSATKVPKPGGRPGEVTILSVGRFRVSRIPEMRSDVGGEPLRGPLPASSGMRPPWLKSTDGPPEVRGCGGRVVGSRWGG